MQRGRGASEAGPGIARHAVARAAALVAIGLFISLAGSAWAYAAGSPALPSPAPAQATFARSSVPTAAATGTPALEPTLALSPSDTTAVAAVDASRWPVLIAFFTVLLAALGLAAWTVRGGTRTSASARVLAARLLLPPLTVPLAAYLAAFVMPRAPNAPSEMAAILVCAAVLSAAGLVAARRVGSRRVAVAVFLVTAAVIAVDQWTGAHLLFANVFSYSRLIGGRFYGLGNEGAGLLLGMLATAAVLSAPPTGSPHEARYSLLAGAIFFAALMTCVAPWWGANFGVAVWGTVLLLVAWYGLRPKSWSAGSLIAAAAAIVVTVVAFVAIDAVLGLTHVGRAVDAIVRGGSPVLLDELGRIAASSATLTLHSVWAVVPLGLLAILGWLRARPPLDVARLMEGTPAIRTFVNAAIAASLVAMVVEDTGLDIVAALAPLGLVVIVLALLEPREGSRTPGREAGS